MLMCRELVQWKLDDLGRSSIISNAMDQNKCVLIKKSCDNPLHSECPKLHYIRKSVEQAKYI